MDKEKLRDKVNGYKLLAESYLKRDIRIFIKDLNDNWYFADILLVGEETLTVQCFAPEDRDGEKITLDWFNVKLMEEYRE